jgi:ribonuclease T2
MQLARIVKIALAALALAVGAGGAALAQRSQSRGEAGEFDYYVLALSWSPTHCIEVGDARRDPQCDRKNGRPYAFVLHGLWPQYERGWPQECRTADRGWVPGPVADRMLDIMPSKRLAFYQYRKHGTCSGLGVDGYFKMARQLYEKVKVPPRYAGIVDERTTVGVGELIDDFLQANPGLKPDMVSVQCGGAGHRLKEVRFCFTKSGEFRSCGRNEDQRRLCSAERMYVPPVRSGKD